MPIFNAIKSENYDLFLMLGDNVYGDTDSNDLIELRDAYEQQRENFDRLNLNFPFEAIWDDHDYGKNDGGKEYIYKVEAEQIFLDFWNIPQDDIRRARPGLYFEKTQEIDGISIQMIFLDTRFFRDALLPTDERGHQGKERYITHTDTKSNIQVICLLAILPDLYDNIAYGCIDQTFHPLLKKTLSIVFSI